MPNIVPNVSMKFSVPFLKYTPSRSKMMPFIMRIAILADLISVFVTYCILNNIQFITIIFIYSLNNIQWIVVGVPQKLIPLLKSGHCAPKITHLSRKTNEPSATLHYNLRKMEREGVIKAYKAVFDPSKIDEGFRAIALLTLSPESYVDPLTVAKKLAKHPSVESVDMCTGDWELIVRLQARGQDEFYSLVKKLFLRKEIAKVKSLVSLKQVKSEFVVL